ncbi:hypothetical protein EV363DRAFT_1267891 [Boletus edulis]|nr:hypothetical protein EV363DRAFT_1267891 [Boletus edulis]
MSSDLQSVLELIVLNNYASLVVVIAAIYDYILTFSKEIEYVWCKRWTWVSTMFVVVRYIGFCWIILSALTGSSLLPGPLEVSNAVFEIVRWAFAVVLSAADLVMILRVYAMWGRSRTILYILLLIFVPQIITTFVFDGIYGAYFSATVVQIYDFSFCNASYVNAPRFHGLSVAAPRLVLGGTLLMLALFQTLKQSIDLFKATKQWQPNRYMQKLAKDGIFYFVVNMLYQINDVLNTVGSPTNTAALLLDTFVYITFYTLIPRFIISIRELYDQDVRGRFHIDTGFGVLSRSNAGLDMTVSGIVFAGTNQGPEVEGGTDGTGDPEMGARVLHGSSLDANASGQEFEIGELVRTLHPHVSATSCRHHDAHLFFPS